MKKFGLVLLVFVLLFGLVLTGCKDDEEDPEGFKLTVTGFTAPAQGKVYGASLMNPSSPTIPIAVGMLDNSGTCEFYHPGANNIPDATKPFNTYGTYALGLALTNTSDITNPIIEKAYIYNGTVTYSAEKKSVTINWSDLTETIIP